MQPSTCTMFVNAKYVLIPLLKWRKWEGGREGVQGDRVPFEPKQTVKHTSFSQYCLLPYIVE